MASIGRGVAAAAPGSAVRPIDDAGRFRCNDGMRTHPRLRVESRPSGRLRWVVGAAVAATLVLLGSLPLAGTVKLAAVVLVVLVTVRELERCGGRGVPALLHVGIDHRLTVTDASGRACDGQVQPGTYVAAGCICLRWRPVPPPGRWRGCRDRTLLIVAGMAPPDVLRDLRVRLRYGAPVRGTNSGVPGVRPDNQSAAAKTRPLAAFD